jgi:hypothetical protein
MYVVLWAFPRFCVHMHTHSYIAVCTCVHTQCDTRLCGKQSKVVSLPTRQVGTHLDNRGIAADRGVARRVSAGVCGLAGLVS